MPQHRLEHYFTAVSPSFVNSGRSFLDLPHHVRRLVYEYVAWERDVVDLNYDNLVVYPSGQYPETLGCRKLVYSSFCGLRRNDTIVCQEEVWEMAPEQAEQDYGWSIWRRPWGGLQSMLLVSKAIHEEIEAYTYSVAVFRVCLGQPLGLLRLWRMSENALSHLQMLTIRLDRPTSEVTDDGWWDTPHPPSHIDTSKKLGREIVRNWVRTLDLLARTITPANLRLNLIFRARTMDDARAILEPMGELPLLRDCGICGELYGQSCFWERQPKVLTSC